MGRPKRSDEAGVIYHMLTRANRRATIFHKGEDDEAFERILTEALDRCSELELFSYCLMPQSLASGCSTYSRWRNEPIQPVAGANA